VPDSSAEFSENQNLFMPKMRAAQIARPGGAFEIVEREIPQPAAGWVRIKVAACGICHSGCW
jgi:alcohol dehydrogenase